MKYSKQICCFLVLVLVVVTCSFVDIGSLARAEETAVPADPPAVVANPVVSTSNLAALEA
jgi:hypothetical protein